MTESSDTPNNDTINPMFVEHLKIVDDQSKVILSGRDSQLRVQDDSPIQD